MLARRRNSARYAALLLRTLRAARMRAAIFLIGDWTRSPPFFIIFLDFIGTYLYI